MFGHCEGYGECGLSSRFIPAGEGTSVETAHKMIQALVFKLRAFII